VTLNIKFCAGIWLPPSKADIKHPLYEFPGLLDPSGGNLPWKILNLTENWCLPARCWKKHCPFILKGRLTTNPILTALHLQSSKSNIYLSIYLSICSLPLSIYAFDWDFIIKVKLSIKHVIDVTKASLALRL
jgi:hypothetical protein